MKERTGKECKKTNCIRYEFYSECNPFMGTGQLTICMNCKNAFVSQYESIKKDIERKE